MSSAKLRTLLEKYGFVRNRGLKAAVFLCRLLPRHDATGSARHNPLFQARRVSIVNSPLPRELRLKMLRHLPHRQPPYH
jgi:hypothetical protein